MKLIFIHGAPAVGKLSVARELATLTGFRLFHNHLTVDLVSSLFAFGSEGFVRLREEIWLAAFREAARQSVSLIFTFNPERSVRQRFIQDTLKVVGSAGQVVFVELICAPDELERRMTNPSRAEFGKLNSVEQYRALLEAGAFYFEGLPVSELSLDTTHSPPAATAGVIWEFLHQTANSG